MSPEHRLAIWNQPGISGKNNENYVIQYSFICDKRELDNIVSLNSSFFIKCSLNKCILRKMSAYFKCSPLGSRQSCARSFCSRLNKATKRWSHNIWQCWCRSQWKYLPTASSPFVENQEMSTYLKSSLKYLKKKKKQLWVHSSCFVALGRTTQLWHSFWQTFH